MWLDSPSKAMQSCKITFSRKRLSQELQEIKVSKSTGGTKANFSKKKFFLKNFMWLDSPSKIKLRLLIAKFEETLVSKVTAWQSS
jgi:hypothetical protein